MTGAVEPNGMVPAAQTGEPRSGPGVTAAHLLPLVYDELRRLARRYLAQERPGHTLEATALVHEAYLRLGTQHRADWHGASHFRAVAAQAMRRVLVDHARRRGAAKRGGNQVAVTLSDVAAETGRRDVSLHEILTLDEAIEALATIDAREARIVELRFFGGLTMEEVADHLGVSLRTVESDWKHARAWLRRALTTGVGR